MAIERKEQLAGTADDPDVITLGQEFEIIPEPSRQDQIREAAEILITESEILVDDEINAAPPAPMLPFDANLVEDIDRSELMSLASDVLS